MNDAIASAQGDRIDFAGKYPQFRLFAAKVYDELASNNLAWIKIGDPEAGNLDDIQYATNTEVHAFQVKWSATYKPPAFRYKELIQLLPDLLTSWQKLALANQSGNKRLQVYLLSNRLPSEHDRLKINGSSLGSFRQYIANIWNPLQAGSTLSTLAPNWRLFVTQELASCGIDQGEFVQFVQSCTLLFGDNLPERSAHRHYHTYKKDTDAVFDFILNELHDPARRIRFTADELLKKLHWDDRLRENFSHDFFVDPTLYEPNSVTLTALSSAVEALTGGYIFVQGGPGTGKSTLLTEWAKDRSERVIRYFIYLNQGAANGRTSTRGDALHLYHDLSVQLANQGVFKEGVLHATWDLGQLQSVFARQLVELQRDFERTGQKTIIVVDGLDHIPREYHPNQNLLHSLPAPEEIPEGIYLVLGSQTYELTDLFAPVQQAFRQTERRVEVKALSRATVGAIVTRRLGISLPETIQEQIFLRSAGHPLYLSYVLRGLSSIQVSQMAMSLATFPLIDGDIELYYNSIWREFSDDETFTELIGLIARLRYGVHHRMLTEWQLSFTQKRLLRQLLDQFFDQFFGYRSFFHNSFRQFVIKQSATDVLTGAFDEQEDKSLYGQLSERSRQSSDRLFRHDYLYYLYQAGRYDTFTEVATASYFDEQRHNLRPIDQIIDDLRLGLTIAAQQHNLNKLLTYGFLTAETQNRSYHQDQSQFFTLFPQLLPLDSLAEYALTLSSEQIKPTFQLVRLLYRTSYRSEARRLFALKEPIELSRNELVLTPRLDSQFHVHSTDELLTEWIRTVALWSDPASLVIKILSLTYQESPGAVEFAHVAEYEQKRLGQLRAAMLEALVDSLSAARETRISIKAVLRQLRELRPDSIHLLIRVYRLVIEDCLDDGDKSLANDLLAQLLDQFTPAQVIGTLWRVSVAELIYQVRRDQVLIRAWLADISSIETSEDEPSISFGEDTFDQYQPDRWFISLKTYLGDPVQLHDYFKERTGDDTEEYNVLINWLRIIGQIAQLAGAGNHQFLLNAPALLPFIRFYYSMPKGHYHHRYWYFVEKGRPGYFRELVRTIGLYGHRTVERAAKLFKQEFLQQPSHWPAKLRKQILVHLGHHGFSIEQVKSEISHAESVLLDEETEVMGRQKEAYKQAELWLTLGEPDKAKDWLERSSDEAFGIKNEKDYQLSDWAAWLKQTNAAEPAKAGLRIRWLAGYIKHVQHVTQSAAAQGLGDELVEAAWTWNNRAGIELFTWTLASGYTKLQDGLASLLETLLVGGDETVIPVIASFYGQVLLYNSSNVERPLLKLLVSRIRQHTDHDILLDKLLLDIDRYALPENRPTYREILLEVDVDYQILRYIPDGRDHWKTATKIHIGDRVPMTNKAIATLFTTVDELKVLTRQAKLTSNGGSLAWQPVLQKAKKELAENGVATMLEALPADKHVAFNLVTALAELAQEVGQVNTARRIGQQLLTDNRAGWLINYDGGKQLAAHKVLTRLDGESAHKAAWVDFVRSFIESGDIAYLRELNTILPIIDPHYDVREVWTHIEHYITRMMDKADQDEGVPVLDGYEGVSAETCLAMVTLRLANSCEKGVSESAQVFFAHQLSAERPIFAKILIDSFTDADSFGRLMFTRIMLYLAKYRPTLLNQFTDPIQQLLNDRLFNVKISAYQLWEQVGERLPPITTLVQPLPWGGYWHLYQQGVFYTTSDESQHWLDGKIEADAVFQLINSQLQLVAQLTGVPQFILEQRVVEFLDAELSDEQSALSRQVRAGEYGIEAISYPYTFLADYVVNVVLGELVEHGYFPQWRDWSGIAPFFDPDLWQIKHHGWPSFTTGIVSPENVQHGSYHLDQAWVSNADQSLELLRITQGEQIVLGERSFFRGLGWQYESELRESCVDFFTVGKRFVFHEGAFKNYNRLMMAEATTKTDYPSLIIANHGLNLFDTPHNISTWLAFNPRVAGEMGWRLSDQNTFKWVNSDNNVMVESIFWADGNTRMNPPHLGTETGSGWLVLASQEAFNRLSTRYKLVQRQHVRRWSRVKSTGEPKVGEASRSLVL